MSKYTNFLFGFLLIYFSSQISAQENLPATQIQVDQFTVAQLQLAAEEGDPDAQYALGYMYYNGKSVPQDTQKGLNWIKRASVQDQEQAVQAMQILDATPANQVAQNHTPENSPHLSQDVPQDASPEQTNIQPTSASNAEPVHHTSPMPVDDISAPIWIADKQAIKNAPGDYYTIQLLTTSNELELNRYIQQYALKNKAQYYATKKSDYVLLYGIYRTRAEAQASLLKLPDEIKAQKPWVKKLAQVRGSIKI